MTDRIKGLTISLEQDVRVDDLEPLMDAIRQFSGVADVTPLVASSDDWLARSRVRSELAEDFLDMYKKITERNS